MQTYTQRNSAEILLIRHFAINSKVASCVTAGFSHSATIFVHHVLHCDIVDCTASSQSPLSSTASLCLTLIDGYSILAENIREEGNSSLMFRGELIHQFSNVGHISFARSFPGFVRRRDSMRVVLGPRDAHRVEVQKGDMLSVEATGQRIMLLAFDCRGRSALDLLDTVSSGTVESCDFDCAELLGWIAAQGGKGDDRFPCAVIDDADGFVALKARAACTVWALHPLSANQLVGDASPGEATVSLRPANAGNATPLPQPLGSVRDEFTVERGTAKAYSVERGEIIQIIDVEGQQCSDFMAFRTSGLDHGAEWMIDSTATRSMVRRAYPGPGLLDKFFDREMNPLLSVVQDTCGRHDTFGLACTARGYEERGFPGHLNCSDNMSDELAPYGIARRAAWPAVNFFWSTWIDPDSHSILTEESHSRPGDWVAMRALDNLVCVSTACPDDIDPINGWNPTDVHVRIYRADTQLTRAVAYREKEDASMSISQESAFHSRTSRLTEQFAPARDLWAPVTFPSYGTLGEYWACRESATLQDMSSLRKYDIVGPDAERLLQRAMTRDIGRLAVWRGTYALMCDEVGSVIDDGTLFRLAPDLFRWCCGTEESARVLSELAESENWQVRVHGHGGALPNLALQGPRSRDVLQGLVFTVPTVPSLDNLRWFGVTVARLRNREGAPFMLSRTGYTGELGYELFCSRSHAEELWDALMEAGEEHDIAPMGSAALEILRVEAGLPSPGAEFAPGVDAHEAGLGFAVALDKKADFTGRAALERNARDPRRRLRGLLLNGDEAPVAGSHVYAGERPVGTVTSAVRSPLLEQAVAMAHIAVEHAETGAQLEVGQLDGRMKRLPATVADAPFVDPERKRPRL